VSRFVFISLTVASLFAGCVIPDSEPTPANPKSLVVSSLVPVLEAEGSVRVIVGVRDSAKTRLGHAKMHVKSFASMPFHVMSVSDSAELEALAADPDVLSIEPDVLAPPSLAESTTMIGAKTAWAAGYTGEGWAVAVLDTGVMKAHTHLAGKVISEACYSTTYANAGSTSLCPGGVTSTTASGAAAPCTLGGCDHGTHVAAIAASSNATNGGVAKGANVIAMQVFSEFSSQLHCGSSTPCVLSYSSDWIEGLERVLALSQSGTKIAAVNLSLGGGMNTSACDANYPAIKTAIDNLAAAGIATVIAAGNDGYTNAVGFPGCISSAVTVGATTKSDAVASYSNASNMIDVFAPGSSITAAVTTSTTAVGGKSGTSMATPHVAGAFAVMRSANPSLTVAQGLAALQGTGTAISDARSNGSVTKPRIAVAAAITSMAAPLPCTHVAPAITVAQPARVATPQLVRYTARVTNRDPSACNAQPFDIAGSAPAGWTVTNATATLEPGASTDVNIDVTPPASAITGATVTFMVTNAMMSAYTASTTAPYALDCGRAPPEMVLDVAGPQMIGVRVTNHDDAACGATSTFRITVTTELEVSPKIGDIVVDNSGEKYAGLVIGAAGEGSYPVHITLADATGAIVAADDMMIEINGEGTTTPDAKSPFDIGCRSTRSAGSSGFGIVLALGLVLRRRRRR
jgi:subtilisin family serine protease